MLARTVNAVSVIYSDLMKALSYNTAYMKQCHNIHINPNIIVCHTDSACSLSV